MRRSAVLSFCTAGFMMFAACGNRSGRDKDNDLGPGKGGDSRQTDWSAAQQHTLDRLNAYRAGLELPPLALSSSLSDFATAGNDELAAGGSWHGHFSRAGSSIFQEGFCQSAAENQGYWEGRDVYTLIDKILQSMMDEGPGGGHHDNILGRSLRRVGIALKMEGGRLTLTNDFSAGCPDGRNP